MQMMEVGRKGSHSTSHSAPSTPYPSTSRPCSISTSSSNASVASDPFNMSFLTDNNKYYKQLVEDLSIIDNVYDIFEEEFGFEFNGKKLFKIVSNRQLIIY